MQTISTILQVLPYGTRYTDRFGADQMMPRFIAGVRAKIDFELRGPAGEGDELPPYDVQTMVNGATSFFFALDGDYDHTTTPKLLRQSGISVTYDDDGYGTIHAELPPTAQDGIIQYLRTSESIVLIGEIGGLDDNLEKIFSLPVTVQVTNPVWLPGETSSQETPSASDPDYLTAAQVRAYVVSQVAAQLEDAMGQVAKGDPGDKGDKGDPPTLAIGTVEPGTLGAEIEPATDEHGDDIPGSYILNLTIPDSASPVINIGTVTDGETPSAGIELEEDGSYTLSLTLPRGQMGTGIQPLADAWSESTAYSIYQAVRHNGAWWYSLQDGNTGHEPPATRADSAYWKLIVQDGRDGVTPVFSFNPSTDSPSSDAWHEPPYLSTDKYFRLSLDGGFTWGVAMPMAMPSVPVVFQYNPSADGDWAEPTAASSSAQYSTVYGKYMRARNSVSGWGQAIYVLGLDEDNLQRDAQNLRVRFAESVNDDWHATLQEGDAAVQIANASGTILQTYTFALNDGETLDSVEFSPYEDPWHSPVTENDYYLRISPDGGTTFSDPILIRATNVPTGEGTSADLSNYYTKSQVDTRLANKAPSTHTHTKSQITDFAHAHVPADVTGLAAALDAKQDALPSGTAGKFLKKTANGVEWDDAPSGSASVDLSGYYTKSQADTLLASKLSAPSGGSTGQFLKKTANGVEWDTPAGGSSNYNALFDEDVVSIYEGVGHGGSTFGQLWVDNMMLQAMCYDCAEGFTKLFVNTANGHLELIRFTSRGIYAFDKNGHMLREPTMQGYWNSGSRFPANSALLSSSPSGLRSTLSSGNRGAASLSCEVTSANHPEADYVGTYIDETGSGTYTGPSGGVEPDGDGHYWGVAYYYTTDGTSVVRHYYDEWGETMSYPQTFGVLTPAYDEVVNEIDPSILVTLNASDNDGGGDGNNNGGGGDGNNNGGGGDGNNMPTGNIAGQYEIWDITDTCGCAAQWPSALARLDDLENATFAWLAVQRTSGVNKYPSGERWSIDGGTTWKTFGAVECKLLAGQYTVVFADAQNYTKPENQTIVLSAGEHRSVTTAYTATSCTLEMRYLAGVPSGAQWSLDDGSTWHDFNEEVSNITPGSYYVTYKPIQGRVAPEPQYLTLTAGSTRIVQALSYTTPTTGTVTLTFSGTVPPGAGWTIDGQSYTSGDPATLSPGTYAITYASVEGYDSPSTPTSVTVAAGDTLTLAAEYTEQQSSVPASFTLATSASGLAGTWSLVGGTTTEYNGDTYPVYQNGSQYLAMRSDGKPHINSSADVSQTSLWRPNSYTTGVAMSASSLSGGWNNPNDDDDATFTFTET
jgi:hypothetical protein